MARRNRQIEVAGKSDEGDQPVQIDVNAVLFQQIDEVVEPILNLRIELKLVRSLRQLEPILILQHRAAVRADQETAGTVDAHHVVPLPDDRIDVCLEFGLAHVLHAGLPGQKLQRKEAQLLIRPFLENQLSGGVDGHPPVGPGRRTVGDAGEIERRTSPDDEVGEIDRLPLFPLPDFADCRSGSGRGCIRDPDRPEIDLRPGRSVPENELRQRRRPDSAGIGGDGEHDAVALPARRNIEALHRRKIVVGRFAVRNQDFGTARHGAADFKLDGELLLPRRNRFRAECRNDRIIPRLLRQRDFEHRIAGRIAQRIEGERSAVAERHLRIGFAEAPELQLRLRGSRRKQNAAEQDRDEPFQQFHSAPSFPAGTVTVIGPK